MAKVRYRMTSSILAAGCLLSPLWSLISPSRAASPASSPPPVQFIGKDSGWIPFQIFDHNRLLFPVTVNGNRVEAVLDSGASLVVLDTHYADSIGVKAEDFDVGSGVGGRTKTGIAHHVIVKVGDLTINAADAAIADHSGIEKRSGHALPVVLGGEAFKDTVVDIDFARQRIAFRDPNSFKPPADACVLPLLKSHEIRALDMVVEGRTARMHFDLGNGTPILLYPRFWDRSDFLAERHTAPILSGGFTGASVHKQTILHTISVGGTEFRGAPAILRAKPAGDDQSDGVDGNVGFPVLSRFHLFVDFPHDRLFLAPPIDSTTPFRVNYTGLQLHREATAATIDFVAPGSPAAAIGLQAGDRITSVRDAASGKGLSTIGDWLTASPGVRFNLTLWDGRSLSLSPARYF